MNLAAKLRVLATFARVRWWEPRYTAAALRNRQARLLASQLRYLERHSAELGPQIRAARGLRRVNPANALEVLAALPVMDKSSMMRDFDSLVTVPVTRDRALETALAQECSRDFTGTLAGCSVGLSSGTSGHRGLFVVSPREREQWVGTVLALALPRGRSLLGHRIALFLRADNTLYEAAASRAVSFRFFDTFAPLEPQVVGLAAYGPTILVGPPSVLGELARLAGLQGIELRPQRLISVAEVLDDFQAAKLKRDFDVDTVHQLYQCTEGFLGASCSFGALHLNESVVHFEREYIAPGRWVPLVTDLRRRAQPIVRYRMGDVLLDRSEPCPCGSAATVLERIEGRSDDALVGVAASGERVVIFADLVARAMVYAHGVSDYQVVQTAQGELTVHLAYAEGEPAQHEHVRRAVQTELVRLWNAHGLADPQVTFVPFTHDVRVKLRRVIRQESP